MTTATPAPAHRCFTMTFAHRVQGRLALASWRIRGQSTRGPMPPSSAGNSVRTTIVETSGISTPPMPTLRRPGTGRTISANRPIATVRPDTATVRPAVSQARMTAEWLSSPCSRSSRHRVTSSRL